MKRLLFALIIIFEVTISFKVFSQTLTIQPLVICVGDQTTFVASFTPSAKTPAYYQFYFGNGNTNINQPNIAQPTYFTWFNTQAGNWTGQAKVTYTDSTSETLIKNFSVYNRPIASYALIASSKDSQCFKGNSFCFIDSSMQNPNSPSNPINSCYWVFGDGGALENCNPVVCNSYTSFNPSYSVVLRIVDTKGCWSEAYSPKGYDSVHLFTAPQASFNFSGTPKCFSSNYSFQNTMTLPVSKVKSYQWLFGDSSVYSATAPFNSTQIAGYNSIQHTYAKNGIFQPSLIVKTTEGCSDTITKSSANSTNLPQNINFNFKITTSLNPSSNIGMDSFCASNSNLFFNQDPIPFFQPGMGDFVWNFGDANNPYTNYDSISWNPSHTYTGVGKLITKLILKNICPDTSVTDTFEILGPKSTIENPILSSVITDRHKYQCGTNDTVDFVNNSRYYKSNHVNRVWEFNDDFAPLCYAYSTPKTGVNPPFNSAQQQYNNSNHYYISGGVTYSGKMNCRYSLDTLPRHLFTNWDSVYLWYQNGKTFPANSGITNLSANTPLNISPTHPVPDPYWLSQGKTLNLISGTLRNKYDSITYTIPGFGTFKRYGNQTIPNSSLTFFEYVFRYVVPHPYKVSLTLRDSLNHASGSLVSCSSTDTVILSHGKPDAHGLGISGSLCPGLWVPGKIQFNLAPGIIGNAGTKPGLGQTMVLINFDSLADRQDGTPCTLDGFTNYSGGITPGGISRPPFSSGVNFNPFMMWPDQHQSSLYYHYGAGSYTPPPADSLGYVTIGLIIGNGCANPPACTQPLVMSDTVWYHQKLKLNWLDASVNIVNQYLLHYKNEPITFIPSNPFQDSVKIDLWQWGDGTTTVDSFWYAGYDVTDQFYAHGIRRVRYNFKDNWSLLDSTPFPLGLPRTAGRYYQRSYNTWNNCSNSINPNANTLIMDSAMMLAPIVHKYIRTSYDVSKLSGDPWAGNTITQLFRFIQSVSGCGSSISQPLTVGTIDTFLTQHELGNPDTSFCLLETIYFNDSIRYFRYDNQITNVPIQNFDRSRDVIYADPPFISFQFDTINFWQRNAKNTNNIASIKLNPFTNKMDTAYNERVYWDYGDGSSKYSGTKPQHQYTSAGKYKVTMVSRDSTGHFDTCISYININKPLAIPMVSNPNIPCSGNVQFLDASSINNSGGSITKRYWNFGDGPDLYATQASIANPSWQYTRSGRYNVKLTVTNDFGCSSTGTLSVRVLGPRPYYRIVSPATGCKPYKIGVINLADSIDRISPADTPTFCTVFYWGDNTGGWPDYGKRDTVWHTYQDTGSYLIMAVGRDVDQYSAPQCPVQYYPDTTYGKKAIMIHVISSALGIISGITNIKLNDTSTYSVSPDAGSIFSWSSIGGSIISGAGSNSIQVKWISGGIHYITVDKTGSFGCHDRDSLLVSVNMTSVKENSALSDIFIYPNPAKTEITLSLISNHSQQIAVKFFDVLGKLCFSDIIENASGNVVKTYQVSQIPVGMYFMEIKAVYGHKVSKVIIE